MNKLDKQVGAAKGWKYCPWGSEKSKNNFGDIGPIPEGFIFWEDGREYHMDGSCGWWSTSDAKALELVDELAEPLFFIERYGKPGEKRWKAHFALGQRLTYFDKEREATVSIPDAPKDIYGEAATRPEAICRAYIAAREWMATKAGA